MKATPAGRGAANRCERAIVNTGLATPEAVVSLYLESIVANDLTCALRAYATHEHAAAFDFTALVNWVQTLNPSRIRAPAQYPMFVEINELRAEGELADATKAFVYGLLTDIDPGSVQPMESEAEIQAFLQAVNPARLATLKVLRIDQPRQFVADGPKAQALFKKFATLDGADEMTERIALYELSGHFFWSGFRLGRYDKTWKIYSLESTYGGPIHGVMGKTTVAEYEARTPLAADLEPQIEKPAEREPEQPPRGETAAHGVRPASARPTVRVTANQCQRELATTSLATPEAAVHLYVESIAANDLSCALRAYAAHEYATRFDFTAHVSFIRAFSPGIVKAPAEYPMFVELNELRAKAKMAEGTKRFVYGLLADRDPLGSHRITSDADIQAFVQAVNPARLATLKVVRIDQPRQSLTNGAEAQALYKARAARDRAHEITERIALYALSGQYFWSAFELRRYDKTWKIYEFGSEYGPVGAVPGKTSAADYEARLQ